MQSLIFFVAPTACGQVTEHSLTAASPPCGLHTKINLDSKVVLVTCFTTESFQRGSFSLLILFVILAHFLSYVLYKCMGSFVLHVIAQEMSSVIVTMALKSFPSLPVTLLDFNISLKTEPLVSKTFLLLALVSELRNLSCCERNELTECVQPDRKGIYEVHLCTVCTIYLYGSPIRNIIHGQKKYILNSLEKLLEL